MKIKALVPFSTGTISMEQYEVKEVDEGDGRELIAAGVAVEIGGGSGGGVLVVTDTNGTLDKTWQEIADADIAVVIVASENNTLHLSVYNVSESNHGVSCIIMGRSGAAERSYVASSADGYPILG